MRFAGADMETEKGNFVSSLKLNENTEIDYSVLDRSLDKDLDKGLDNQTEKEPLTLKKATPSDALLQGFVTTDFFQNVILTASIEFGSPSFFSETINSVAYYFSSSSFFRTLFSCFISPNAP